MFKKYFLTIGSITSLAFAPILTSCSLELPSLERELKSELLKIQKIIKDKYNVLSQELAKLGEAASSKSKKELEEINALLQGDYSDEGIQNMIEEFSTLSFENKERILRKVNSLNWAYETFGEILG
ncbi:hypothetical protein [Mycoplasma sp. Ms02]|uniref:hypothetical protein n=1 Tax=Mycoplasma sp. Ms02 TaxID=353851 RepID=UPI001C8AB1A7|nr:hypothetical protein [Mycoplasma sp. Ms02]QZE12377.1 hypothetical protein K4L35_00075 [Mycoplasma sp. Ms02]